MRGNIAVRVGHSFIIVLGIAHGCLKGSGHLGICTRYFAASLVAVTLNYRSVTNTIYMYLLITFIYFFSFLPPTTKLGQGYVFTRVCDSVHRGESVSVLRGGLCPGGLSLGGLCLGESLSWRPPYGNERAVRILLECILVVEYKYIYR